MRVILIFLLFLPLALAAQPEEHWEFSLDEEVSEVAISQEGGYVAAGTLDGKLVLFDGKKEKLFSKQLEAPVRSLLVGKGGDEVLAGGDSYLYCFNSSGTLLWKTELYDKINDIAFNGERISAVTSSRHGFLLGQRGRVLFRKELDFSAWGTALGEDRVYFSTAGGTVYSFDLHGGERWRYSHGSFIADMARGRETLALASSKVVFLRGTAAEAYYPSRGEFNSISYAGKSFLATTREKAVALSPEGKELWELDQDREIASSMAGRDEFVLGYGDRVALYSKPDFEPPRIELLSPKNGSTVSGVVEIDFELSEPSTVRVLIDGNYACPSACNWDTSASARGEHTIKVVAEDRWGNLASREIKVLLVREPQAQEKPPKAAEEKNYTPEKAVMNKTAPQPEGGEGYNLKYLVTAFSAGLALPLLLYSFIRWRRRDVFDEL